jgi:hypothetical protein
MCDHDNIADNGICMSCGVDINSQEFLDSLPPAPEDLSYLGDLMGIIRIAQTTAQEYTRRLVTEPQPELVWAEILPPSFIVAKVLGYRGDYQRWGEVCKEYTEHIDNLPSIL